MVSGDQLFMGFADGYLIALGLEDGVPSGSASSRPSGGSAFLDVDTTVAADGQGHVYAASYKDGVYALDAKTGDIEWTSVRPGINGLPRGSTLFMTGDGIVWAMEGDGQGPCAVVAGLVRPLVEGALGERRATADDVARVPGGADLDWAGLR